MQSRLRWFGWFALGGMLALVLLFALYQLPPVKYRLEWRFDRAEGVIRGWIRPENTLPTPHGADRVAAVPTQAPPTATEATAGGALGPTPTPSPSPTPIPDQVQLPAPEWERQDWNNCGPATLSMGLRFYGWEGDQFLISDLLKPDRGDKNVNVEELVYYVRTRAGWLSADFRVGGDLAQLKRFIAAGIPVIVEKGFVLPESDGGGGWAGHYLLLTGYDEAEQEFIAQDTNPTTGGSNRRVGYQELDQGWRAFNRVYMFVFLPEQQETVNQLLGPNTNEEFNREQALETARRELESDAEDAYAWFNLGTNLVYFERYGEAAKAYDQALSLGLPWRFTRYQFGPYISYFNMGRYQDLIELADATLFRTSKAEESRLWRGWARYQQGDIAGAEADFLRALEINPNYLDAQYALDFIRSNG
jgi:tetratricopeptide (TPR) repeat protein